VFVKATHRINLPTRPQVGGLLWVRGWGLPFELIPQRYGP
jgi:hypothetical protein